MTRTLANISSRFTMMNDDEMMTLDGGLVLFTIFGLAVTAKMCIAAGGTIGIAGGSVAAAIIFG